MDDKVTLNGPIEADKLNSEIRQEPYPLPDGLEWSTLNLNEPHILEELYQLLSENYVEDDNCLFRFDYPPEFLRWALLPPGWIQEWNCGVRDTKTKCLVGFISAIPAKVRVYDITRQMVEVNFLCLHTNLRSKRIAPILKNEMTRRMNIHGVFQALYTTGIALSNSIGVCRYYLRSLNPKKLFEVKFAHFTRKMKIEKIIELYKLPDNPETEGFRRMEHKDIHSVCKLLGEYLNENFDLAPVFSPEDFQHWFLSQSDVVYSYVVEKNGNISDFVSYYLEPLSVKNHSIHKTVKTAYLFYYVSTETPLVDLINDALISARNNGFDVFSTLDFMENMKFLKKLKFYEGDGNLQYYLANWRCPPIPPNKIGFVTQ